MLIGYVSDLHCEMDDEMVKVPDGVEVLVLAGDIHVRPKLLKDYLIRLCAHTNAQIVYVPGNHEYYGHTFPEIRDNYWAQVQKIPRAVMLEKNTYEIGGVRFLGTTLWSDLSDPMHAFDVEQGLNDFYKIHINRQPDPNKDKKFGRFRAADYTAEFQACVAWLEQELKKPYDGKTVVVTHYSPSPITCAPAYKYSRIRHGFHSDISDLVIDHGPDVWVYGHDHVTATHQLGETQLVSYQPGYPHEHRGGAVARTFEV